jgi:hypothetical protein
MDTNIKILIGVVVVVILLIIGILIFKHRENFNYGKIPSPEQNYYNYLMALYVAINQTIIPDFYNSDRTTDITQCQQIDWPKSIQNHTTINQLNKAYAQFKAEYKDDLEKLIPLYMSTDSVTYTAQYNKLANILINMSIPDPLLINLTRLNASIVLGGSPDIPTKLRDKYSNEFVKLQDFVQNLTPL